MRRRSPSPSLLHFLTTDPETGPAFRMHAQAMALAPRQTFDVLSEDDLVIVTARFRTFLARTMRIPEGRIAAKIFAAPIPLDRTKSGLVVDFDPPLSAEENDLFVQVLESFNVYMGGRPLIWAHELEPPERGRGIMIHGSKIDLLPMPETLRRVAAELEKSNAGEESSAIVFEDPIHSLTDRLDYVETIAARLLENPITDEEGAHEIIAHVRAAARELRAAAAEAADGEPPSARLRAAGDAFEAASMKLLPLAKRRLS